MPSLCLFAPPHPPPPPLLLALSCTNHLPYRSCVALLQEHLSGCLHQLKIRCRKTALIGTGERGGGRGKRSRRVARFATSRHERKRLRMIRTRFRTSVPTPLLMRLHPVRTAKTHVNAPIISSSPNESVSRTIRNGACCETTSLTSPGAIAVRFHAGESTCLAKIASCNISRCQYPRALNLLH